MWPTPTRKRGATGGSGKQRGKGKSTGKRKDGSAHGGRLCLLLVQLMLLFVLLILLTTDEINCRAYSLSVSIPVPRAATGVKLFLVDSGASHHCVREISLFSTFRAGRHAVRIADNKIVPAMGKGTVTTVRVTDRNGKGVG